MLHDTIGHIEDGEQENEIDGNRLGLYWSIELIRDCRESLPYSYPQLAS